MKKNSMIVKTTVKYDLQKYLRSENSKYHIQVTNNRINLAKKNKRSDKYITECKLKV
jgi:hypothetical protein